MSSPDSGPGVAVVRRVVAAPAPLVWDVVTDWPRHGRYVWATTVRSEGAAGAGQRFIATTGLGPVRLRDVMEVVEWQPPTDGEGRLRLEKRESVLTGWAEIVVRPLGERQAELLWHEEIVPDIPTPRFAKSVEQQLSRRLTGLMVGRLARGLSGEAERLS